MNNLDIVKGGPWTWVDRQDSRRKSCLDIGIISWSLIPYLKTVEIDVNRQFTPRRVQKKKKQIVTTFSDHFALKVELSGIPRKQEVSRTETNWNLGKPGGWDLYEKVSNEAAEKII
jgi:hypothetical protein